MAEKSIAWQVKQVIIPNRRIMLICRRGTHEKDCSACTCRLPEFLLEITGMELAREIGMIAPDTPVVFLTDSDAYAIEAFSVRALHYVLKPVTEQSLRECLNRLEERRSARRRVHIVSSSGV